MSLSNDILTCEMLESDIKVVKSKNLNLLLKQQIIRQIEETEEQPEIASPVEPIEKNVSFHSQVSLKETTIKFYSEDEISTKYEDIKIELANIQVEETNAALQRQILIENYDLAEALLDNILQYLDCLILARKDQNQQQQQKYSEWRQLWYPNFEEFSRAEAMAGAENNTITNVTVQLGATAYLHCHVRSTGDRTLAGAEQVSWVRRRDWHILSSGVFTYTNDERFQILHAEGSDDWTLQIKYVQKRDNGTYECQVSTGQGLISHFVNLQIVVPEATIQGTRSGEHHVDVGSIIDLVCIIERSPTPPQYVFWYHNDHMINYDTARGGISVETVPGPRTQSRLTIRDTNDADSGNYTCSASNTEPASIYVFVSEGDNVDAILMRKSCSMCIASQIAIILISVLTSAMR